MASFDVDRLARRIRRAIGSPSDCAIDDVWIDDIIDDAIRRYSSFNPIRESVQVAVTKDVNSYSFPTGYFEVDHSVQVEHNIVPDLTGYQSSFGVCTQGIVNGGNLHNATMEARRLLHINEDADRVFPPLKYWQQGGFLVSEPPPSESGNTFVPLLKYHDCNTFPSIHLDELRILSTSIAAYEWAAHLSKFTEVKMSNTAVVKFRDPKWLREEGKRYMDEFVTRMGAKGFGPVTA